MANKLRVGQHELAVPFRKILNDLKEVKRKEEPEEAKVLNI